MYHSVFYCLGTVPLRVSDVFYMNHDVFALHSYFHAEAGELENRINDTGDWDDDIEKQFESLLENFKKTQTY